MADLIGIATWNFSEGNLTQRIDRFVEMGYNAVSLIASDARALCKGETPDVEEAIKRHSLPVTIHTGLAPTRQPVQADALIADFKLFTEWHSKTNSLVSINYDAAKINTGDGNWEYQTDAMCDVVAKMLDISDGDGFTVGIEDWPLNDEQLREADELRAYPHYGILIDLGHMNMRIRKPDDPDDVFPIDTVRDCLNRITLPVNELHIHNNNGRRDLHAPPTIGTADMTAVAGLLADKGIKCISTIELVPAWCGLTEDQGWIAAKDALEYWKKVF